MPFRAACQLIFRIKRSLNCAKLTQRGVFLWLTFGGRAGRADEPASLAAMFIFTRAGSKRRIAQMSPFDYLNAQEFHRRRAGDES